MVKCSGAMLNNIKGKQKFDEKEEQSYFNWRIKQKSLCKVTVVDILLHVKHIKNERGKPSLKYNLVIY